METVEYIVVGVVDKPKPAVKIDDVEDILASVAEVEKEQPVIKKPGRPRKA